MFGMTKRQFLKRSKKALNETGAILLLIREISIKQSTGKISDEDASKKLNNIRKDIESVFFMFEESNPPSECFKLKGRILKNLINLQDAVNLNQDHLRDGEKQEEYLNQSLKLMEGFRMEFNALVNELDALLIKKKEI